MYQLFERDSTLHFSTKMHPRLDNLRRIEQENLNKVKRHYRQTTYFAKGDNPLVTLLRQLPAYTGQDYRSYYYLIKDNYLKYASSVGFVCEQRSGGTKASQNLSGDGYQDVIIGIGGASYNRDWLVNWRDLEPVKVLRHDNTALRYLPIDGRERAAAGDAPVVVYSVDIPLLALQYILYQNYVLENEQQLEAYTHFVMMYPMVNILASYNDQVVINRMQHNFFGQSTDNRTVTPSIAVVDNHGLLDEIVEYQVNAILDTSIKSFEHQIHYYPTLFRAPWAAVQIPDILDVRATTWAWETSKLPLIYLLLKANESRLALFTNEVTKWRRSLRELETGRLMEVGNTHPDVREETTRYLADIGELLNR